MEIEASPDESDCAKLYLILYNIGKKSNVKELLLSSQIFSVYEVLIVGPRKIEASLQDMLDEIRHKFVPTLEECRDYLKALNVQIAGVEIMGDARSVTDNPFYGDTAIMMGNEGSGLSGRQARICDYFVYIPQFGGGTASLNVTVAASIIMHAFATWAGAEEFVPEVEALAVS